MISNQTIPFAPGKENHLVSKSDTDTPKGEGDQKSDVFKMLFQSYQNQESDGDKTQGASENNPELASETEEDSSENSESTIFSDGEDNETVLKAGKEGQNASESDSETEDGNDESGDKTNGRVLGGRFTLGDEGNPAESGLNTDSEQAEASENGEASSESAENSETLAASGENRKAGAEGEKTASKTNQQNTSATGQTNTDGETSNTGNGDAEKADLTKQEGSEESKKDQQLKAPASGNRGTEEENSKTDSVSGKEGKQGGINEVKIEGSDKVAHSILQGNSEGNQTDQQQNGDRQVKEDTVRQNIPKRIQQLFASGAQGHNTQPGSRPDMPVGETAPDEADKSMAGNQKEQVENLFRTVQSGNVVKSEAEILNLKASQVRELNFQKYRTNISNRPELATDTKTTLSGNTSASDNSIDKQTFSSINGSMPADASTLTDQTADEGEILWKEHTMEYLESKEKSSTDSQIQGLSRLSQLPITNVSLRRNFVPGISQSILQATGGGKETSETWHKHNFSLENGKNIQVSSRQIDGVLQLKLGSSHSELNKLLSQHLNEIREHLEKECDLQVELELNSGGNQDLSEFFGESSSNNPNGDQKQAGGQQEKTTSATVEEVLPKSVRKFGYNQMEWTA